jgi:Tfp pilus assembly protein PilO
MVNVTNIAEKEVLKNDYTQIKSALLNFIVPIICIGISAALFFVFIFPALKSIPETETKIEASTSLENQLDKKLKNLRKLVDFQSALTENANLVTDVLVSEAQVPQLFTQIDQIAKEAGLTITRLSYSITTGGLPTGALDANSAQGAAQPTFKSVTVTAGVTGTYDQFITFVQNLENSARLVNVSNFRYAVNSDKETGGLDFSVTLESPYMFVQSNAVTDDPVDLDIAGKDFSALIAKIKTMRIYKPTIEDVNKFANIEETKEGTPSQQPTPTPTPTQ